MFQQHIRTGRQTRQPGHQGEGARKSALANVSRHGFRALNKKAFRREFAAWPEQERTEQRETEKRQDSFAFH